MSTGKGTFPSKDGPGHSRLFEHGQDDIIGLERTPQAPQPYTQPHQTQTHSHAQAEARERARAHAEAQASPYQPRSVLGALSISLYQSLSFSRSPSFERTRYIASTCTFIAIIYLRTLHCLFFGTGALSCAVLAKCLKHTIRQPRPQRPEDIAEDIAEDCVEDMRTTTAIPTTSSPSTTGETSGSISTTSPSGTSLSSSSSSSNTLSTSLPTNNSDTIPRASSPTLSLAPSTALQKEQVDASNEVKARIASIQRFRRQRRLGKLHFRVDYGMPSSHAQLVAFFVTYISLQLVLMEPEGSPGQWFLILLLQLYAWSVVWSRVRLGSHTVSQVLVGAGVGALYGMVWFAIWSWKVEEMIKHWQWMDRYGVIQVRKIWRQLEMDEAVAVGRAGGRMYFQEDQGFPLRGQYLRF